MSKSTSSMQDGRDAADRGRIAWCAWTTRLASSSALALILLTQTDAAAQHWPLFFPEPPADAVQVTRNVPFATADTTTLRMDVYRRR